MSKVIETLRSKKKIIVDSDFLAPPGWFYSVTNHGYAILQVYNPKDKKYKRIYLHRYIMNPAKNEQVDHVNGDRLDNRKENLRVCSSAENSRNRTSYTGRYKGVSFDKRRSLWRAYIVIDNTQKHLGYWKTDLDAAIAYNLGALLYHKEFASLNDI